MRSGNNAGNMMSMIEFRLCFEPYDDDTEIQIDAIGPREEVTGWLRSLTSRRVTVPLSSGVAIGATVSDRSTGESWSLDSDVPGGSLTMDINFASLNERWVMSDGGWVETPGAGVMIDGVIVDYDPAE